MRMILKPAFYFRTAFLSFFLHYFLFGVVGTVLVGGIGAFIFQAMEIPYFYSFAFAAIAFLLGPLLPFGFWLKVFYSRLEYVLTEDTLEYPEGFLFSEKNNLNLEDIDRISTRQNHFQKQLGIGTILLWAGPGAARVRIPDVVNPDEARVRMMERVDQCRKSSTGGAVQ